MLFALSKNVASTTVIEAVLIISFMLLEVVAAAPVVVVGSEVIPVAALAGLIFCILPVMSSWPPLLLLLPAVG